MTDIKLYRLPGACSRVTMTAREQAASLKKEKERA